MAEFSVFYAWQSDRPRLLTRQVIHEAATQAIEQLNLDATFEDSPRLDHDTKDDSGLVHIADTIYSKLDRSAIVIADLTFVASTDSSSDEKRPKALSNPNVLLELGYAAAKIGWDRLIVVMNEAFGKPDELIFDLRHRRFPLTFRLGPDPKPDKLTIDRATKSLAEDIKNALIIVGQAEHTAVIRAIECLNADCLGLIHAQGGVLYFSADLYQSDASGLVRFHDAINRLLDIALLRCETNPTGGQYAYHWTYLGKLVIKTLKVAERPPQSSVTVQAVNADQEAGVSRS